MISERQVAKSFDDMWRHATPLLRPKFVAMFNTAYCEHLRDADGKLSNPVDSRPDNEPSVVAELGYLLAKSQLEERRTNEEIRLDVDIIASCKELARSRIARYSQLAESKIEISENELEEAFEIALRYEWFVRSEDAGRVKFAPSIPGAGIVNSCEADISLGDCLWEVKSVRRNVAGKDIRQLLVYLALGTASGRYSWTHAGIFNPRMGLYHKFKIEGFVGLLSGNMSASEVFHEMISYLSSREIQIDTVF